MSKINLTKTISFILVTKDRPDLALQAIDKIKNIITEKDELILVNGGKDDINHPLITKTIKENDNSPGHAINKGMMAASGKYIRTVSDDDTIRKKQFYDAIKVLDENLSVDFLVCGGVRERVDEIYPFYIPKGANYGQNINDIAKYGACGQGFIFRTSSLPLIGLHPVGLASDLEYVMQAISNGGTVKFCRINLFHHPIHEDSVTIKQKTEWQKDLFNIYSKYGINTNENSFVKNILVNVAKKILPTIYANRQKKYSKRIFNADLLNENSPLWDKGFS